MPIAVGILKEITPYNHIFRNGRVPLISIYPCRPCEYKPPCLYIDGEILSDIQIEALTWLYFNENLDKSYEDAYVAIRMGYPIEEEFFQARFLTTDGWYSK